MRRLLLSSLSLLLVTVIPLGADLAADSLASIAPELSSALDEAGTAEAAFIRRGFIKKKGGFGNFRTTVIVGDDANHDVEKVDVTLTPIGGAPSPTSSSLSLTLKTNNSSGNRQFDTSGLSFSGGDPVNESYTMTSTMKDGANNAVGDPVIETVKVTGGGSSGLLDSVTVVRVDDTNFQVQVEISGDPTGAVTTANVAFYEWDVTEPSPEEVALDTPARQGHRSTFTLSTLTFGDPDSAVGQSMGGVVDLIQADGTVAESADFELIVEGN